MPSSFGSPAASLRESFLVALLDSAVDYAIVATDLDGRILEWNRGAEVASGWPAAEAVGRTVDILFPPEDAAAGLPSAQMRAAFDADGPVAIDGWHWRRDGTTFWCDGKLMPLRDSSSIVMGFLRIQRDRTERREAEGRLHRSERALDAERGILRAVIRQAPVGISVAGATPEVPSMFSATAEEILGHGLGEAGDVRYRDYGAVHADGRPYVHAEYPTLRALRDGEVVRDEDMLYRQEGTGETRLLRFSSEPVRDDGGGIIASVSVFEDVTDTRRTAGENRQLAAVVEQSADFIGIARTDGTVAFVNPAGLALVGLPDLAAARGHHIEDYIAPGDRADALPAMLSALGSEGRWRGRLHLRSFADDVPIPVSCSITPVRDASGAVTHYAAVARDLRDRVRAEAALEASEAQLRTVMDTVPVGILLAEAPSGRILMGNRRLEEILGHATLYAPDHATYDRYVAFHADGRRVAADEWPLARICSGGSQRATLEVEYVRPGDGRVWIAIEGEAIRDADGATVGAVVVITDVGDRKRAEAAQDMVNHEVGHRLNNTLAMVQAIAVQTLRNAPSLDAAREALVSRLLALSKAHDTLLAGHAGGASVSAVANAALTLHDDGQGRIHLSGPGIMVGPLAAQALALMLHELATNAVKYGALSVREGRIAVDWSVTPGQDGDEFALTWTESGGPTVVAPARRGFGSRLIERGFGGTSQVDVAYDLTGVVCRLRMPLRGFAG